MNVDTITMDPAEARDRLRHYRRALHRSADEEYKAVAAGYAALAEGHRLIDYATAIRETDRDEKGRPMLALARADRRQVKYNRPHWGSRVTFSTCSGDVTRRGGMDSGTYAALYPDGLLVREIDMRERHSAYATGYALVPLVPGNVLVDIGGHSALRKHLILWEVEEWADNVIGARPDIDPYLLRPVHGTIAAVVAEWDLTELERAVMAGRAAL